MNRLKLLIKTLNSLLRMLFNKQKKNYRGKLELLKKSTRIMKTKCMRNEIKHPGKLLLRSLLLRKDNRREVLDPASITLGARVPREDLPALITLLSLLMKDSVLSIAHLSMKCFLRLATRCLDLIMQPHSPSSLKQLLLPGTSVTRVRAVFVMVKVVLGTNLSKFQLV